MSEDRLHPVPVSLPALADELLERARESKALRAGQGVYTRKAGLLREVMTALTAGSTLDDHEAPQDATLQVIRGRVLLTSQAENWELGEGELIAIPQAIHGVQALEDSVFLLTIVHTHARS